MSHIQNVNVKYRDSESVDAFGRARISAPFNTFDTQFNYNLQPLFFEEDNTGNGAISHQADISAARLSTGGTDANDEAIFQCFQYVRYQPGKSNYVSFTSTLGTGKANVRQRIGLFDDENGLFWEQDSSNLKVVRRTKTSGSVVDNAVNQSSWNLDVLDGSGSSGITLDTTKDNIFVIDYQWLGAGRVRYGFDFGGTITYVHQIKNANVLAVPFMTTGNLPFRVAIKNTAGAASLTTMDLFCMTVVSEGGFNPLGVIHSASNGATTISVTTRRAILSIRPKTSFNSITNRGHVLPEFLKIYSEDVAIFWELVLNTTLGGTPSWTDRGANSLVEFDVAGTTVTGGEIIDGGYVAAAGIGANTNPGTDERSILSKMALTLDKAGTGQDVLSVVVTSIVGATDVSASLTWKELY